MFSYFSKLLYSYFIIVLIICLLFIPILYAYDLNSNYPNNDNTFYSDLFVWPIPGYTTISSYFGKRNSPTAGASTNHLGVDIPAPEGTYLYAIDDGIVTFASWGAGRWLYYRN